MIRLICIASLVLLGCSVDYPDDLYSCSSGSDDECPGDLRCFSQLCRRSPPPGSDGGIDSGVDTLGVDTLGVDTLGVDTGGVDGGLLSCPALGEVQIGIDGAAGGTALVLAADVDSDGYLYIGGEFSGDLYPEAEYGVSSIGGTDMFVAKLSPAGQVIWVVAAGGAPTDDRVTGLVVDETARPPRVIFVGRSSAGGMSRAKLGTISLTTPETLVRPVLQTFDPGTVWHGITMTGSARIFLAGSRTTKLGTNGLIYEWTDEAGSPFAQVREVPGSAYLAIDSAGETLFAAGWSEPESGLPVGEVRAVESLDDATDDMLFRDAGAVNGSEFHGVAVTDDSVWVAGSSDRNLLFATANVPMWMPGATRDVTRQEFTSMGGEARGSGITMAGSHPFATGWVEAMEDTDLFGIGVERRPFALAFERGLASSVGLFDVSVSSNANEGRAIAYSERCGIVYLVGRSLGSLSVDDRPALVNAEQDGFVFSLLASEP